jgi:hypothetical protein
LCWRRLINWSSSEAVHINIHIKKIINFLKTQHSMDATEHIFLGYAEALKRFLAEKRQ